MNDSRSIEMKGSECSCNEMVVLNIHRDDDNSEINPSPHTLEKLPNGNNNPTIIIEDCVQETVMVFDGGDCEKLHDHVEFDSEDYTSPNESNCYFSCRSAFFSLCSRHRVGVARCAIGTFVLLYLAYFSYAIYLHGSEPEVRGLIAVTVVGVAVIFGKAVGFRRVVKVVNKQAHNHPKTATWIKRFLAFACACVALVTLVTEVILRRPGNLRSLCGVVLINVSVYLTSTHPHKVSWRPVISGILLQYLFALAILRVPWIRSGFQWVASLLNTIIGFSFEGQTLLFGKEPHLQGFIFHLIPTIVLVMALLTVLEHLGVLHALMMIVGRFLALCLGCSAPESLNASANIFLGPLDSLVLIRPFLEKITPSQLHCLMTNGMSTVTGSIMGVYILLGISAQHLLSASVMSAPAALSLAKLAVPETMSNANDMLFEDMTSASRFQSVMDAASSGAISALTMAAYIVANVTAVVSGMKMVDAALWYLGALVGRPEVSIQVICSYIFYPLAISMGVDLQDGLKVASLIGVKTFVNEIVAYSTLGTYRRNRELLDTYTASNHTDWHEVVDKGLSLYPSIVLPAWNTSLAGGIVTERSEMITTYALCGFANFISVGIIVGCYIVMIPGKKDLVFSLVLRAMVMGNCASFLTASVAGLFY